MRLRFWCICIDIFPEFDLTIPLFEQQWPLVVKHLTSRLSASKIAEVLKRDAPTH